MKFWKVETAPNGNLTRGVPHPLIFFLFFFFFLFFSFSSSSSYSSPMTHTLSLLPPSLSVLIRGSTSGYYQAVQISQGCSEGIEVVGCRSMVTELQRWTRTEARVSAISSQRWNGLLWPFLTTNLDGFMFSVSSFSK